MKGLARSRTLVESGHGAEAGRQASWWLPAELPSVRRARRLTRATLAEWGFEDQIEVAELLVSELVGNALDHTRGQARLSFAAVDGRLRCEVEDEDPELPSMRAVDVDAESGRGLFLVDMLSNCWGSVATARGKAIWFELPAFADAHVESLDALEAIAA
ncbi:ATP-binding protein [Nonomuraea turkmeniaca]|uniref:ATP-binding protein n=1 Tax=Nonomuraea turkmeniaca TaxID=103838 RepID=A0A5S4F8P9_9ACTN|nr:ATP-binding protein [Nonomuraea turkmeniaca]TMR12420.1 ATP-binding protein [Nonomuraea turkmeniaca]